jgi:hypothetical protein
MTESRLSSLTSSPTTTTYARLGSFYGTSTPYTTDPTTTGSYMFGSSASSFPYPSLVSHSCADLFILTISVRERERT